MKSFVDKIPGLHRPKLDRVSRILAYSQTLQDVHPFCDLDEFLATVLEPDEVRALAKRNAINAAWTQLQNDPLELPALWAVDTRGEGEWEGGDPQVHACVALNCRVCFVRAKRLQDLCLRLACIFHDVYYVKQ